MPRPAFLAALSRIRRNDMVSSWLVLAAGLAVTVWVWQVLDGSLERQAQQRFEHRVEEIEQAIRERLRTYRQILQGSAGLFAASQEVTRREWRDYVGSLDLAINSPGIQGLGYARLIPAGQRQATIDSVRREGFPDFSIWPPRESGEASAVLYLEPFNARNRRAFGFDMTSEPTRRAAMERARSSGLPSLSGKVGLVQETGRDIQAGFLMYVPVYRAGLPPESPALRGQALLGWVYAMFRMDDLMRGILGDAKVPDIDLEIFDGENTSQASQMYDSDRMSRADYSTPFSSTRRTLDISGRVWYLHLHALPGFEAGTARWQSHLALATGSLISFLVFALTRNLITTRRRAQGLADEMTAVLAHSEQRYRQMFVVNQAVKLVIDPASGAIVDANPAAVSYYGYNMAQLKAMRISQINTMPTDELRIEMAAAMAEKRLYFNFKHRLANGEIRDVEVFGGPITEAGNNLLYAVIHDVTLRNQTMSQQRALLDNAVVGIIYLRDRRFLWINPKAEQMLGYGSAELQGQSSRIIYADAEDYENLGEQAYPALARDEQFQTELLLRRKDGTCLWTYMSGKLLDPANSAGESIWILLDIDEQHRSGEALAARTRDLQEANQDLELLSQMTNLLQGCDTPEQAYRHIVSYLPQILTGTSGMLFAGVDEQHEWPAVVHWGDATHAPLERQTCWAWRSGRPQQFEPEPEHDETRCPSAPMRRVFCLPLVTQGQQFGVFHVVCEQALGENRELMRQQLSHAIAGRIALTLSNLRLRQSLRELSLRDPLTGLHNRRHLDALLDYEVRLALRKSRKLAVIMLDIDHFKLFNDRFGHDAGDFVLREVGAVLAHLVRETDTACRYGGEEFLLLLPETDLATALERAERLRLELRALALTYHGHALGGVSASLGVAVLPDHAANGLDLVAAADGALYRAKASGRDRVMACRLETPA